MGRSRAVTLLYHDVVQRDLAESGFRSVAADRYKLTAAAFACHLDAVAQASAKAATSVLDGIGPDSFHITFDDGGSSSLAIADALERRGWIGHFFVPTDYIGTAGFLDRDGVKALARRGHVVGSHSCSHPPAMAELSEDLLAREWRTSTTVLSDIIGRPVVCGSIPGGSYARRVAQAASDAGLSILYTSEPTAAPWRLGDLTLLGRFSVVDKTGPAAAAAFARCDTAAVAGQMLAWNTKRAVRSVAGPLWGVARDVILKARKQG